MNIRNWRDWFIPPTAEEDEFAANELARIQSGTGHRDDSYKKIPAEIVPHCAKCKEPMGFDDGMYVMLTAEWRVHIGCFNEVLQRHFENGEAIDFETGNIVNVGKGID